MPGIMTMASRGAERALAPREPETKKRKFDDKTPNGERSAARMDTPAAGAPVNGAVGAPGVNGASIAVPPLADQMAQLPPELEQVGLEFYHPLGKMIERISQGCSNDLHEVLRKMADLPVNKLTNGYGMVNGGQENAEVNREKKKLMIAFAQQSRTKFIKLAVLTDWGKKAAGDVAECINLFSWTRQQSTAMNTADEAIEWMKICTDSARQPNPDIRTALEVFATKKADWIPDMGYIPPEAISSEKALKLLRYMNTSLSIRLNVHETLPRPFEKWRVESGRATFIVDEEFELDLISFVEDTSEQWHFIDLRLLFSPAPSIAVGSHFQLQIKAIMDQILREKCQDGLDECYNWLHIFILTHKINVLRSQAYELVRDAWTKALKIESVHRGLVVQYWIDKPGKKNWIEIGINSNKPKNGKKSWRGPPIPSLAIRWFRQGALVTDADLHCDWKNLSLERLLKHVTARHIAHLLRITHQSLHPAVNSKTSFSESEPSECRLEASLGSGEKTTLSVEPFTGDYVVQPITSQSSGAENAMNRPQEASNTGVILAQLLARSVIEHITRIAQQVGWRSIARQSLRLDAVKEAVKLDVSQFALFRPRCWTPSWALASLVDASGASWWIVELASNGSTIKSTRRIAIEGPDGRVPPINRTTLTGIGRIAVHTLAFHVTTRELDKQGKAYSLGDEFAQSRHNSPSRNVMRGWVLHLKTADLLTSKADEPRWLEPAMRVMCQGLRSNSRDVWHIASGNMLPDAAADMQRLMSASPQKNFSFSEGGNFHILLSTPFGEGIITELKARLRDVHRLRSFATILEKRKMALGSSSLQQVQFQYGQHLAATVKFDEGDNVKVQFSNNNPHKRIEPLLAALANDELPATEQLPVDGNSPLDRFCTTLLLTRPLLTTIEDILAQQTGNFENPAVHPHAIGTYRITYANPICSFDIRIRSKEDRALWYVEDNETKAPDFRPKNERPPIHKRPENLKAALQKLYLESGDRWFGVRQGIIAEIDGIPGALRRLHETVLSCYVEGGFKQEPGNAGPPAPGNNGPSANGGRSAPTGAPPGPPRNKGPAPKPHNGSAPNAKMAPGKMSSSASGKPGTGVKQEIITID